MSTEPAPQSKHRGRKTLPETAASKVPSGRSPRGVRRRQDVSRRRRHPPFESRSHQGLCRSRQGPTRWCRATATFRSDWLRPRHHPTGALRDDTASTGVGFGHCMRWCEAHAARADARTRTRRVPLQVHQCCIRDRGRQQRGCTVPLLRVARHVHQHAVVAVRRPRVWKWEPEEAHHEVPTGVAELSW